MACDYDKVSMLHGLKSSFLVWRLCHATMTKCQCRIRSLVTFLVWRFCPFLLHLWCSVAWFCYFFIIALKLSMNWLIFFHLTLVCLYWMLALILVLKHWFLLKNKQKAYDLDGRNLSDNGVIKPLLSHQLFTISLSFSSTILVTPKKLELTKTFVYNEVWYK